MKKAAIREAIVAAIVMAMIMFEGTQIKEF
jgi:hypothetical protein